MFRVDERNSINATTRNILFLFVCVQKKKRRKKRSHRRESACKYARARAHARTHSHTYTHTHTHTHMLRERERQRISERERERERYIKKNRDQQLKQSKNWMNVVLGVDLRQKLHTFYSLRSAQCVSYSGCCRQISNVSSTMPIVSWRICYRKSQNLTSYAGFVCKRLGLWQRHEHRLTDVSWGLSLIHIWRCRRWP